MATYVALKLQELPELLRWVLLDIIEGHPNPQQSIHDWLWALSHGFITHWDELHKTMSECAHACRSQLDSGAMTLVELAELNEIPIPSFGAMLPCTKELASTAHVAEPGPALRTDITLAETMRWAVAYCYFALDAFDAIVDNDESCCVLAELLGMPCQALSANGSPFGQTVADMREALSSTPRPLSIPLLREAIVASLGHTMGGHSASFDHFLQCSRPCFEDHDA